MDGQEDGPDPIRATSDPSDSSRHPRSFSPTTGGALWLIAAGVSFSGMGALARLVAEDHDVHPFEIAFFRSLIALVPMLFLMRRLRLSLVPPRHTRLYLLRAVAEFVAMLAWFTGVTLLPLGEFTAVAFTSVLFAVLVARLFLKEPLGAHRLLAVLAGFTGALIILRPGAEGLSIGALAALLTALAVAVSRVSTRVIAKTRPANEIVFYVVLYTTPMAALAAAFNWTTPSLVAIAMMAGVAAAASAGQFFLARAYRQADVSALAPFDFLQIPIAGLIGFAAFGQRPDLVALTGAAIICGATLYALYRARLKPLSPNGDGTIPLRGSSR